MCGLDIDVPLIISEPGPGISVPATICACSAGPMLVVLPAMAYERGLATWLIPAALWLALPAVVLLVVPIVRGLALDSLHEYLEHRFDTRVRLAASLLFIAWRLLWVAAAGLAVGILTVPIVASVAEDALRAVPMALREASFGLGARRAQTTFRVVFPAAISGIIAALILGISRAVGETMVVAIAAGATGGGLRSFDPLQPGQTMTAAMAALGFGSDQVAGANLAFQSLYFVGLLLFLLTLLLNFVGDRLVARIREEY